MPEVVFGGPWLIEGTSSLRCCYIQTNRFTKRMESSFGRVSKLVVSRHLTISFGLEQQGLLVFREASWFRAKPAGLMLVKRRCPTWFNRGIASKSPCSLNDSKCLQYTVPAAGPCGKFIFTYVFMFVCLHVFAVCFKKHIFYYICLGLQYISRYYKIFRFMLLRLETWFFMKNSEFTWNFRMFTVATGYFVREPFKPCSTVPLE